MKEIKIDLKPLITKLEAVLKRGFTHDLMAGNYQSVYKGKGMEFVGFREYDPGDDALLIDWKASLKTHRPMVRVLEEERNLTVMFLLDVSDSMLHASHSKLKCEYAAELVATLCYAIHAVGDSVGLVMYSNKVVKLIPPSLGKNQFYRIVRALSDPSLYGGKGDLQFAINYLLSLKFLQKDSIVFLVSDFIGMKPGWDRSMKFAGLKFDFTALVIRDPIDMRLPDVAGQVHLADVFSERQMVINPREAKKLYEQEARSQVVRLERELLKTASSALLLETDKEFVAEIFKFFKIRRKRKKG